MDIHLWGFVLGLLDKALFKTTLFFLDGQMLSYWYFQNREQMTSCTIEVFLLMLGCFSMRRMMSVSV
jgi:hypothetical protein